MSCSQFTLRREREEVVGFFAGERGLLMWVGFGGFGRVRRHDRGDRVASVTRERVTEIEVLGARGGYLDEGRGPTLVLVVTPFVTAAMYYPARVALSQRFRVITVELPGTAG